MKIKLFSPIDLTLASVVESRINEYLKSIKDEDFVDVRLTVDAEGNGYVMIITK